jgi:hypothetical protein
MFGRKKKTQYAKLTEREIKILEKSMSKRELKEFRKRQKQARDKNMLDQLMELEFLDEDLFE